MFGQLHEECAKGDSSEGLSACGLTPVTTSFRPFNPAMSQTLSAACEPEHSTVSLPLSAFGLQPFHAK